LRERPGDLLPLAEHLLGVHGRRLGRRARLSAAAQAKLAAHAWPGNIRELDNVIQRALILAPGELIEPAHLLLGGTAMSALEPAPAPVAVSDAVPPAPTADLPAAPLPGATPANIKDLERQHILETLARVGGSRKKAVELLGISERTLRYKLAQYRAEGVWHEDEE